MSKALKIVGTIAGAVGAIALIGSGIGAALGGTMMLAGVGSAASIAAVAGAVAGAANLGAQALAKPPPARGSITQVVIASNIEAPYVMGEGYFAGVLRHDTAYGATLKKVPNPYRWMVSVYTTAGPVHSVTPYVELAPVSAWYSGFLYTDTQLGACPEASALAPNFAGAPGWAASAKLSGQAAIGWNLKFDKDGKRYASGIPRLGAYGKWVKVYDPRKDSTFPGGSGAHRLGNEATYEWSENPALHAGTYAFGRFQNGKHIFGIGIPADGIDWVGIAGWANVCEANGWTIFGVIYEPGDRWSNLTEICAAGGGRQVFAQGRLSWMWSAPKVALDTITDADIADESYSVTAMTSWRDRLNSIIPKYRSPEHDWELVPQETAISVPSYITEDGELKQVEWPFNFVKRKDQAAQLAAYKLMDSRELQPITLPCLPRLRRYRPGECLHIFLPELGLDTDAIILSRDFDPARMVVTFTLMGETPGKHDYALGRTGTPPPTPALKQTVEERDNLRWTAMLDQGARTVEYDGIAIYSQGMTARWPDGSTWEYINATPGSGNAPPIWPETSNAWWSILTPPLNRGKVFVQTTAPTAAESTGGDIWQDDNGRYWIRRGDNHLSLGGKRLMLGGKLLTITWTPVGSQPVLTIAEAAAAAQQVADAATASATAANAALADIANDGLLTPGEKPDVSLNVQTITSEQAGIDAQATAYGITTEKTAYDSAVSALTTYLETLTTPVGWNILTGNTTIDGPTFRAKFADVYDKRQILLNKIAEKAGTTAVWGGVGGAGKPEDNADVTSQITGQAEINIAANSAGTPTVPLPVTAPFRLIRNGTDVTAAATWSVTVLSGTIAASFPSPGSLSLNSSGGVLSSATLQLTAVYGSTTRNMDVRVTRNDAAPPSGGGSGGGGSSSFSATSSSTSPTALSPELSLTVGASGNVDLTAGYSFSVSGSVVNARLFTQWYEWNGSAYVAISGTAKESDDGYSTFIGEPASGTNSRQITGLTPAAAKKYRLYGYNSGGSTGSARYVNGTVGAASS